MSRTAKSHWIDLWRALGAQGDAAPWHQRLVAAYAEPTRHYHNLRHLEDCLRELDSARTLAQNPALVEAALWFHDAVYDPASPRNEEDSAQLAIDCFTGAAVSPASIDLIRQLILATKTHAPGATADAALLIDIDLAILGQPPPRFWEYERAIRSEYASVPAATFSEKRAEILTHFLARPFLYHTDFFRQKYEHVARTNLRAAIAALQTAPS